MSSPKGGMKVAANFELPATWCAVECMFCLETWTVDTADFDPPLTVQQVTDLMVPLLDEHTLDCT